MTLPAYTAMMAHVKQTRALSQVGELLSWDQEVMMPPNGAAARAEQAAAVEAITHQRRTDSQLGAWLQDLQGATVDDVQAANIRLARRSYDRSKKVPAALVEELARVTVRAQGIWAKARQANRFADFAPSLKEIIDLKRQEAACLATDGRSSYDVLLDDFEPGMTVAVLQPLLESMRPRLSRLRQKIAESGVEQPGLTGPFATDRQLDLARKLAGVVGYDWNSGRLDLSVHPFSSGTAGDARITTRVDADDPLGCLYSTVHELGHALYEQGISDGMDFSPVAHHVSMGVHESQSRLWENQIARSRSFCQWLYPHFIDAFGDCGVSSADALYQAVNYVKTGFVRTEADEVHYNLHVLLRFELERDLISGALEVEGLEQAWNTRFERDFGVAVPDAANGVLQDVHWSAGLFGYFPTYSLGNIYSAQLEQALREKIPDLDARLSEGQTDQVLHWLQENVHRHGSLYAPGELIEKASGATVSTEPLLVYLETKYSEMFGL